MNIKIALSIIVLLFAVACGEAEPTAVPLEIPTLPPASVTELDNNETAAESATTLPPTPTLVSTAAPLIEEPPTAVPPIPPAVTDGLPATTADLLFLADGSLKLWRHNPAQIETLITGGTAVASPEENMNRMYVPLVGDAAAFSVSGDGRHAAVARMTNASAIQVGADQSYTQTIGSYEIIYIHLPTNEQRILMPALHSINAPVVSLSLDGGNLAISGLSAGALADVDIQQDGELYVMQTAVNSIPKIIDRCNDICREMVWHNDNNFFVYGGSDGLKMYNLSAAAPELLLSGEKNEDAPFGKYYGPISWANNGRYLLLWYRAGIEGGERAVFDMPAKQLMIVPHSSAYIGPFAHMVWMNDARLFLVRLDSGTQQAIGETLRIDVDGSQIGLDETVILGSERYPAGPMHWENGRFGYGLFSVSGGGGMSAIGDGESDLYQRISFNEDAARLNALPSATSANPQLIWTADGSGAIFSDNGSIWYISTAGEPIQDMQTAVGPAAHSFHWLP